MTYIAWLPTLNAIFNACSAILLVTGYLLIRRGRRDEHKLAMLGATGFSLAFLVSYVTYHVQVGSYPFSGTGGVRTLYFVILIPHTILAVANVPLVITTLRRGLGGRYAQHKSLARKTLPVWLYVSITGVIIYIMLYVIEFT
ncbi:MAG: DUF420 domain-containing protein [Candidatus Marinimicrobia bacterium]|nr:DUF420 domain-containing protein [Candidatus Neomarinimicrobiota bacterium]